MIHLLEFLIEILSLPKEDLFEKQNASLMDSLLPIEICVELWQGPRCIALHAYSFLTNGVWGPHCRLLWPNDQKNRWMEMNRVIQCKQNTFNRNWNKLEKYKSDVILGEINLNSFPNFEEVPIRGRFEAFESKEIEEKGQA